MQLTSHSDYAFRVLIYLGCFPEERVTIREISSAYSISHNHLMKVVQRLSQHGLLDATRGRSGGLKLGKPPSEINVGTVIRHMEPHLHLAECFDISTSKCVLSPSCHLQDALSKARSAFMETLDGYSLADFLQNPEELRALLQPTFSVNAEGSQPIPEQAPHQNLDAHGSGS